MSRRRLTFAILIALISGCLSVPKLRYLLVQAYFQVELLARRTPLDTAFNNGDIPEKYADKLQVIRQVKRFGESIGLEATDNYDTIAVGWNRTIWNVSASRPDRFAPKRWWFPITGSVPYLGYFRQQDARLAEQQLQRSGFDVYVRTAGAYSTLGWFRDPILPAMLRWSEYSLASTLLHELAHATLWIPGSIKFNESFANVVGERAGLQYLAHTYGPESDELNKALQQLEDRARYRELLHELYKNLDTLYQRDDLSPLNWKIESEPSLPLCHNVSLELDSSAPTLSTGSTP